MGTLVRPPIAIAPCPPMRLEIQEDKAAVGRFVANYLAAKINAFAPTKERPFVLGLPTGSSPMPTYQELIKLNKAGKVHVSSRAPALVRSSSFVCARPKRAVTADHAMKPHGKARGFNGKLSGNSMEPL